MADSVKIKGGSKENIPTLPDRELGWCRDEGTLYIGTANGNARIGHTDADILALIDERLGIIVNGKY